MPDFRYTDPLPLGKDNTEYRLLSSEHLSLGDFEGQTILKVAPEALSLLARSAIREVSHLYRSSHLAQLRAILDDPEASENDRFVALQLLKNANIAAGMSLPGCQDTGTALVMAKKGQQVWTGGGDAEALSQGIYQSYTEDNLRYSQVAPLTMFEEVNTGTNLPAQIDIEAVDGQAYKFLFITKGGGSANKTFLFQQSKALLNPQSLMAFLRDKLPLIGTSACPPYHLAIVIGGSSAEQNLKMVKLASARYLDTLPEAGNEYGQAFRDRALETQVLQLTRELGIGAQFGGKYFAHDVRIIRLPRHGASCPVGIGVSCSADRNILGRIDHKGIWLEQLEHDPARFLPEAQAEQLSDHQVRIDLNRPMDQIRAELARHPIKTRLLLSGPIIVARDSAHAKLKERLDRGEGLPDYFKDHIVYYAGPAKTPKGHASGSFGPTTAGRMDSYVALFQQHGGSLVMLAKGNRSPQVAQSCKHHGGFYLGSIGGAAAILAEQSIRKVEVIDYPELGMEAVHRIEVEDFPAFIITDDKGHDFFAELGM
ncbi:MAG: fumarate hydratase [Thiohalomonadaceae bacterium]